MPLTVSDETLNQIGLTEREALFEFACMLFETARMTLKDAAKLAGLSGSDFKLALAASSRTRLGTAPPPSTKAP